MAVCLGYVKLSEIHANRPSSRTTPTSPPIQGTRYVAAGSVLDTNCIIRSSTYYVNLLKAAKPSPNPFHAQSDPIPKQPDTETL